MAQFVTKFIQTKLHASLGDLFKERLHYNHIISQVKLQILEQ